MPTQAAATTPALAGRLAGVHHDTYKAKLPDRLILGVDPAPAGFVPGTIENFAQEFATVVRRIRRLKEWRPSDLSSSATADAPKLAR